MLCAALALGLQSVCSAQIANVETTSWSVAESSRTAHRTAWRQADTVIRDYLLTTDGTTPLDLSPTNVVVSWDVMAYTNITEQWIASTGIVVSGTAGHVRVNLSPTDSNLSTGYYWGFVAAVQYGGTNITNRLCTVPQVIEVRYSPDSRYTTFRGPLTYDVPVSTSTVDFVARANALGAYAIASQNVVGVQSVGATATGAAAVAASALSSNVWAAADSTTNRVPSTGGTMSGNLDMGWREILGVSTMTLSRVAGTRYGTNNYAITIRGAPSVEIGQDTYANQGVAIAAGAWANHDSVSVGMAARSDDVGIAVGWKSVASNDSTAVGGRADAVWRSTAIGCNTRATNFGLALGWSAHAIGSTNIAIGHNVTNDVMNSARVRGTLYLDGATGVAYRATFGSGDWTWIGSGYATGTPLYVETYQGTITGASVAEGSPLGVTTNAGVLAFTIPAAGGGSGMATGLVDTLLAASLASASENQVLKWDGSAWTNAADATGGGVDGTFSVTSSVPPIYLYAFSDSIGLGTPHASGGTPTNSPYKYVSTNWYVLGGSNCSINGANVGTMTTQVYGKARSQPSVSFYAIAINELRPINGDTNKMRTHQSADACLAAFLAVHPDDMILLGNSPLVSWTGTWTSANYYPGGYVTSMVASAAGAAATNIRLYGSAFAVGYTSRTNSGDAAVSVWVDGVSNSSFSCYGARIDDCDNWMPPIYRTYLPQLHIVTNLTMGQHTVELRVEGGSTTNVYLEWIAPCEGVQRDNAPRVYMAGATYCMTNGYATYGGSDLLVQQWNHSLKRKVREMSAAGLPITYVDPGAWHTVTNMSSDGLHPSQQGYAEIGMAYLNAMRLGAEPHWANTRTRLSDDPATTSGSGGDTFSTNGLNNLADTSLPSPSANDVVTWDGTTWTNLPQIAGGTNPTNFNPSVTTLNIPAGTTATITRASGMHDFFVEATNASTWLECEASMLAEDGTANFRMQIRGTNPPTFAQCPTFTNLSLSTGTVAAVFSKLHKSTALICYPLE